MQKKIIALAVAALASTAAFAQTNVTIYGVADASFDVVQISDGMNNAVRTVPGSTGNSTNDWINRVSANSSYIGFKGTEDLGNGLKAVFQYETAINLDNAGGWGATRDSFVGLSSNYGTVVMGNLTGPTRALGASVDMNAGATGIGANTGLIGKFAGARFGSAGAMGPCAASTTCASIFDTRWANTIAYVSPTYAGFSGVAAYVAGENKTDDGLNNTVDTRLTTGYDLGVNWAGAGFKAGIAYNWVQLGNVAADTADNVRIAGGYTGTWGRVNALWEQTSFDINGNVNRQQKYGFGAGFNLGKGEIITQVYTAMDSNNQKPNFEKNGAWMAEVGYVYNLSKRTSLKAIYAYMDNDSAAFNDFGVNASGANGTGNTIQGMQLGVRHNF